MPILRILAAGQRQFASPGMFDLNGRPAFTLGAGEADTLALDYTAALGDETISTSTWAADGASLSGAATDGGTASVRLTAPTDGCAATIRHTLVTSGGRTLKQTVTLLPEPR